MIDDPTDETHRKPRQLRNTPLQKYVRLTSFFLTLCYAGAMYIGYRRHINDPEVVKEFEDCRSQLTEQQRYMIEEFDVFQYLRGTIQNLFNRQKVEVKAETESNDMQTNV
ncbi:hypothetical protein PUN28_009096 [Cardiocondyla obscurior]|uniref:Uncharacterized protein n=1 Tax=Cardiocondyla obscurior TaxID=286306 RepID=A0AAW2FST1_9HYME